MASAETTNTLNASQTQTGSSSGDQAHQWRPNPFFFLSSSESPGTVLATQPLLGTKNYHPWSRAMVLALTAKKKIGFANG